MFQDALQSRAHNGDQAAFREIYNRYSRDVYAVSHTALGSSDSARAVVKQVFLQIYRELMRSEADLDLPARLSALTNEEIRITRIAAGDLDPNALLVQYAIASQPAVDTTDTMERVRAHIQQTSKPAADSVRTDAVLPVQQAEEPPMPEDAQSFEESFASPVEDPAQTALFGDAEEEVFETAPDPAQEHTGQTPPYAADDAQQSYAATAQPPAKKSRRGAVIAGILLLVLLLVFAWLLAGILMDLSILPFYDLGYSLFNEYVFDFFRLP